MRVDPKLEEQICAEPQQTFNVIVRVDGDLQTRESALEAEGFNIRRRFRLISGFAASAKGADIQKVSEADWVVSVEPDQEVRIMESEKE